MFRNIAICPFTVVADTREQRPYSFDGLLDKNGKLIVVPVVRSGMPSGDYSIQGSEMVISIERKSLQDAYHSMTWGRQRFEREIGRLNDYRFAAVVIEASWHEVLHP